jgi:anti-sigma regulatory factor (Ser/Thr protein kinase)
MLFRSRRYRRIRLKIDPHAEFRSILYTLEELSLPDMSCKADHVKYAVLEMINNSLRAHRMAKCPDPVEVVFELAEAVLRVRVRDRGAGFDPRTLPYSLKADPYAIDLNDEVFQEYRRRNNYERFGMGLPLAMRTFDSFELAFVDDAGREVPWQSWDSGSARGTAITVTKALLVERPQGGPADG